MPRLLAVGHVTWDLRAGGEVLGGSVSYGTLTARKLGWEAGVLTAAGPEFEPERDLPGIAVFLARSPVTTRFRNVYGNDGTRQQFLATRAQDVAMLSLPDDWRRPDALLLCPVAGEITSALAPAFEAGCVGAVAQGWLRAFEPDGRVSPQDWDHPERHLTGVHVLFLSEHDLPGGVERARGFLAHVPIVAVTQGWRGVTLLTRAGAQSVPTLPRPEVDPTGAGDVFAAAFLLGYHESGDPVEAAAFACCAASCAVEGVGTTSLGDRAEVQRRIARREHFLEEGEWDD